MSASARQNYIPYKSPYGPSYKISPNIHGMSLRRLTKYTTTTVGFTAATGIFAIFFFAEVPRVRKDIMQKVPFIGSHFDNTVAPEDNPF